MKRKDRDEDIRERRAKYQAGLLNLSSAVRGFKELTGVDLLGDVDVSGRHMGEAPYLKITASRLREITSLIEGDIWRSTVDLLPVEVPAEAKVLTFERRPVVGSYRPGSVRS